MKQGVENPSEWQLEDFLLNDSFIRWIRRVSSADENSYWQQWLAENPKKQKIVKEAAVFVNSFSANTVFDATEAEIDRRLNRLQDLARTR
jgi:transmembrane sensor